MRFKKQLLALFIIGSTAIFSQNSNTLKKQLHHHPQKDTVRCFLLNNLIEAENNQNVWIEYNKELLVIASQKSKDEQNPILKKAFVKYLSIAYNNEGAFYLYSEQYAKAISLYRKSLAMASSIRYDYGSALALQNIGTAYDYLGKIDSTLINMKRAYRFALRSKNQSGLAYVLTDLGYIYNNLGNNELAIQYNLKALPLFEKENDDEGLERTYFALGRIFDNQNDFKLSSFYYSKCLVIDRKTKNKERLILVLNSLAAANVSLEMTDRAVTYTEEALGLALTMNNKDLIAASYKNYGDIYFKKNELQLAETNYLKALSIFKKLEANVSCSKVANKLATIYLKQNQLTKAREYGHEAYDLAEKTKYPSDQKNAAEILSQTYYKLDNFKKAYEYKAMASNISEKIYFDESKDIALKATYQYETEKKEAAIKSLHQAKKIAELETKKKTTTLYLVVLLFLAVGSVSYFLFSRFKNKKENEMLQNKLVEAEKLLQAEKKVTESELKALKSQMNPHFIFNALNSIQMQFMYGDKLVANEQLNNFTYLTRQILEISGKKYISIADETEILTKYLELEKLRFNKDFSYRIAIDKSIDEDYHKIPPMLIQPIVENSLKHGLMHKKGEKKVDIHFGMNQEETYITCSVKDNGIGRVKSAEIKAKNSSTHQSFSTASILQRLELLNNKLKLQNLIEYEDVLGDNDEVTGTITTLRIPL